MFRNLLSRLFTESDDAPALNGQDAEVAIAALLIRVARADDRYSDAERARIDRILGRRRGLSPDEAAERRAAAEMIEAEAPDTVRLTRTIKQRVLLEDRLTVISALWEVVYADGGRGADEEAMVRLASGLLGVSDVDSNLARQRVIAEMGPTV
ncbi:TerB family tellurite resistance protein [Paracoccus suum]|uniref:TerB family tellurite resistance protein n=1 Tax=Paracoccus suum TaxID=2259340 RepID=A0A344PG78_9RHOB|nr:TerB family tellurite resistance protein [Paracoccus suum]AXC48383.1 TerB family tellurite resistance protein [Paracoccus suum]